VADLVEGAEHHSAAAHWHLDPRWEIRVDGHRATLRSDSTQISFHAANGEIQHYAGDPLSGLGWHAPTYGRREPAHALRVSPHAGAPFWLVSVCGLRPHTAVRAVDLLPVWAEAGVLLRSLAIRIERAGSVEYVLIAEPSPKARHDSSWRV